MNEKYRPVILRIAIIALALILGAIGLTRFLSGRADGYLTAERDRAGKLGWEKYVRPPAKATDAEEQALEAQGAAYQAFVNRLGSGTTTLVTNPAVQLLAKDREATLRRTEGSAQILSDALPVLEEAVKHTFVSPKQNFAERRILTYAMTMRALALSDKGQPEQALGTIRVAWLLAQIVADKQWQYASDLDAVVRGAWCKIAAKYPDKVLEAPPSSPALAAYSRGRLMEHIVRDYGSSEDSDPMSTDAKRAEFDRLRNGNAAFERLRAMPDDSYDMWKFVSDQEAATGMAPVSYTPAVAHYPNVDFIGQLALQLREQAVHEQLARVFFEALKNGGNEPASLGQTRDPFNDGKPLKFKKLASGFVVYSVGSDSADGGGAASDLAVQKTAQGARHNLRGDGSWH